MPEKQLITEDHIFWTIFRDVGHHEAGALLYLAEVIASYGEAIVGELQAFNRRQAAEKNGKALASLAALPSSTLNKGKTARHSGKLGDAVYALPVCRQLGLTHLYINPAGSRWEKPLGINQAKELVELLKCQDYLAVELWTGQEYGLDLDEFRVHAADKQKHLIRCHAEAAHLPPFPLGELKPWLTLKPRSVPPILVHQTTRNAGDGSFDWACVEGLDAGFIGTAEEYAAFGGKLPHLRTDTVLAFAESVAGCKALVCNQSLALGVAEALHKPRFVCINAAHNCAFPVTPNGSTSVTRERLLSVCAA